jgi:PAS domain S-box-containing protein
MENSFDSYLDAPEGSNVGQVMRNHDWSMSVLGDPGTWPVSLRSVVELILNSKFPMFVAWGPELGFLYNDAYAEILGKKHPRALGARFEDIWDEIWSDISPIIELALQGRSSYFEDLPLVIDRAGHPERAWFTFSYSPVRDDQRNVAGMYCSVVETTKVVRDRTLRHFQLALADTLHPLTAPDEIVVTAAQMLAEHLEASGCWYAQIDDVAGLFHTKNGWFASQTLTLPRSGKIDDFSPALLPTLKSGREFIADDLSTDPRTRDFADRFSALNIGSILIVPVVKDGKLVFNINVIKPNPYAWSSEEIQAARDVVDRTWVAMENAVAQQQLTIERDKSDHILNSMAEGFIMVSPDLRVNKVNAEGLQILRRWTTEVLGKSHLDLWPERLGSKISTAFQNVVETGEPNTIELNFTSVDESEIWLEIRISSLKNEGLAVFFRDVTTQKRAALALQRSEEHLAALFEQTAAGIAERDLQGRLVRVNERLCQILGRSRNEVMGVNIHDLTHPDDLPRSDAAFRKLLADGQPFEIEKRYLRPDGTPVWVNTTVSLIQGKGQATDSVLAVILDITESKRVEEALQDETRILDHLNRSGQSLAATLDLNTLLQTVTDSGRALTGAQFGAFFYNGKNENGDALMLYTLSGAPREAFDQFGHPRATPVFKPTFDGDAPVRSDDITKDPRYGKMAPHHGMPKGHLPVRSYLAAPVVSRSGEVLGGLFFGHSQPAVFTDRSERLIVGLAAQAAIAVDNARLYELAQKSAEDRQMLLESERVARAEAERLSKSKDEFLAMLAHELRNPLAPVSAAADILRFASNDPDRVRHVSSVISRQITHFTRLIDDLMDVSRVTRGLIQVEMEPLDLKSIVSAAIEQTKSLIETRQHTLTLRIKADHAVVHGDRTRLVQVVANLLTNAAKYTPSRGEITLKIEADGQVARIVVTDNGNGIDAALLPHVFDLFTQGSRGIDRSMGGLGIGLALVKAIVTLHHGEVQAFSQGPGTGSTFTISIPLMHDKGPSFEEKADGINDTQKLRILVVDDNLDAADSLCILLKAVGHTVVVAATAEEAISKAGKEPVDVFILDIGLPDMSGYELVKTLRARPLLSDKTFIALTGYGQPQDRQRSMEAGFSHHFVKPVNNQLLFKVLAEVKLESSQDNA